VANLGAVQLLAEKYEEALDSFEEAERVYRAAVPDGDEMESWRDALRAQALAGVGRTEEAVELAEHAARVARDRGLRWSLPLALTAVARTRAAAGTGGVTEVLDEAATIAKETGAVTNLSSIEEEREALAASR